MKGTESLYSRHRFPPEIIQHTVWLCHRFNLNSRDIEDLLAEAGIVEEKTSSPERYARLAAGA